MKIRLLILLLAAPGVPSRASADGAAVYKKHCAVCHDQAKQQPVRTPAPDELKRLSPEAILATLTKGSMAAQGKEMTEDERRAVAEYLAGKPLGSDAGKPAQPAAGLCPAGSSRGFDPSKGPRWNGWSADPANTRFQTAAAAGLAPAQVPNLKLKWAFGFPGTTTAYAQPTVAGGRVFVGSGMFTANAPGTVYSLDAATGCTHWAFQAASGVRTAISIGPIGARRSLRYAAFFGDLQANAYAVDAATGELIWKTKVEEHPAARITGSPVFHEGRLYVTVSSVEEGSGGSPKYQCCTFRGSILALDAETGKQIWKSYTVPEEPKPTTKNKAGTQLYGPSGAAVWSAPTLDQKRRAVYVATGNNYTEPDSGTSDAILAFDMDTGKMQWKKQMTPGDVWTFSCPTPGRNDCAPDFDIGTSPIVRALPGGKRVLLVGQKSGMVFGLDPDKQGELLWSTRVGKGGALGGVEWGSAADEQAVYAAVSDRTIPEPETAGALFALNLATGEKIWGTPAPKPECAGTPAAAATSGGLRRCTNAQSAAVTAIPGVVFSGSVDGRLRAYSTANGSILWDFNTAQEYTTVNQVKAKGGALDAAGPAVAGGMVFVNSGYGLWGGAPGNVLLAFGADR